MADKDDLNVAPFAGISKQPPLTSQPRNVGGEECNSLNDEVCIEILKGSNTAWVVMLEHGYQLNVKRDKHKWKQPLSGF